MYKKNKKNIIVFVIFLAAVIAAAGGITWIVRQNDKEEQQSERRWALGEGIYIVASESYSGAYVEDGTDEPVEDVWQLTVTNESANDVQYMVISAVCGDDSATFELTTLLPGSSMTVQESSRSAFPENEEEWSYSIETTALFQEELSLHSDLLNVYAKDNWIKVENKSSENLTQDIYVYYKKMDGDVFRGGITYRIRFEGGLAPGETAEKQVAHYNSEDSQIMYITCQQEGI